jgi:hypothetical protein
MSKQCTVPRGEAIVKGDAVCVMGFDPANNRPTVKKATRDNLATSNTVFGVAEDDAAGGSVVVLVAGEVAENAITSLGAGKSNIVATDIHNATAANQCRLIRVVRPDGSEYVAGTCDENGNLVVQPRASRETSNPHVFNARSYGALGDGAADDGAAITNAVSAIAASGGNLFFPSGTYSVANELVIPPHVHVTFEEGAMLAPAGAAVTIQGPVTCHPAQRVFGGTGVNKPITQVGPGPAATVRGSPSGHYSVVVTIHTPGGLPAPLGTATFTYSLNGGLDSFPESTTAASVALPSTGLTIDFGASPPDFGDGTTYTWTSQAPMTFGPAAFERFNVRNFGAVPDYDPRTRIGTDNLPFFQAALAAMAASGNRSAKLVADGHFFLSDTLVLTQTIVLEGTAMNEPPPFPPSRSTPGTLLAFPKNVTGIRIRSADLHDNPHASAEKTVLRNLTLWCEERDAMGDGVRSTIGFSAENVTIENFAGDGFHVTAGLEESGLDGNVIGTGLRHCVVGGCGRDGFHFEGGNANACVIEGCSGLKNGRSGFFDATFGNTYLGCLAEGNLGPNFITDLDSNASVFINCWSEAGSPPSQFHGQPTIISGKIGGHPDYMTQDSSAFILEHGVATRAPLVYQNYQRNNHGTKPFRISLGDASETTQGPGTQMIALNWATLDATGNPEDSTWLRYLDGDEPDFIPRRRHWWGLINNDFGYRHLIRFPTMLTNARQPAPWFPNGIFLGRDDDGLADDPPKVLFTAAPEPPKAQYNSSSSPITYERGDVVWNSKPSAGGPMGQVCIASGTLTGTPFVGVQTDVPVNLGDTTVKLNQVDGLASGQYITMGGGTDVYTVVKVTPANSTIDISPGALANVPLREAIAFSLARFATIGSVRGTVTVDVTVTTALDASYETIKLIGSLAADTTITVPSEDGWSARFLDLTTRNGHELKVNAATSPGMADFALTNGQTQRLYIEDDVSVSVYNIRPEGPSA